MSKINPKWPDGPWNNEPDHEDWVDEFTGYKCEIHRKPWNGALCGYVISPIAIFYADFKVHGGVTYNRECKIGFDCDHYGDFAPSELDCYLSSQYRDWDYVKCEVTSLARQIKEYVAFVPEFELVFTGFKERINENSK